MCQEHTVTRLRPALGTLVAIEARGSDAQSVDRALAAGFAAVGAIEHRLHPTRPGSDLARLNRSRAGSRVPVHPSTVAVLELSRQLALASGGRFEPALPGHGSILAWLPAGHDAILVRSRAHVDLGGIAKGFAVDLAVEAMRSAGAASGLVNAGGDLRVYGRERWKTWLRAADGAAREVVLAECALAVSDACSSRRPGEHRGYYAVRAAGRPRRACCAVIAGCAVLADALTKVVMHASPAQSATILAQFRARAIAPHAPLGIST